MCLNSSHKISASTYTKDKTPEIGLQKYHVLKWGRGRVETQQCFRCLLEQTKQAKNASPDIQIYQQHFDFTFIKSIFGKVLTGRPSSSCRGWLALHKKRGGEQSKTKL